MGIFVMADIQTKVVKVFNHLHASHQNMAGSIKSILFQKGMPTWILIESDINKEELALPFHDSIISQYEK